MIFDIFPFEFVPSVDSSTHRSTWTTNFGARFHEATATRDHSEDPPATNLHLEDHLEHIPKPTLKDITEKCQWNSTQSEHETTKDEEVMAETTPASVLLATTVANRATLHATVNRATRTRSTDGSA